MLSLNEYIAKQIVRGTKLKFGGLQSAYFEYQRKNQTMSTGSINDSNKIGNSADGFNAKRDDLTNSGSHEPNAVTGQSGAANTSPVTSGLTAASQVSPLVVKNVDARPIQGSHSDSTVKSVPTSTDSLKNQSSPRGETEQAGG
jgi:hypothetical protein